MMDGTVFVVDPKTGVLSQKSIDELKRGKTSSYEAYEQEELERIRKVSQAQVEAEAVEEIMQEADATHSDPMPMIANYKGIDLSTLSGKTVTLRDGSTAFVNSVTANGNDFTEIDIVPIDPATGITRTGENGEEIHRLLNVADVTAVDGVPVRPETVAAQTTPPVGEGVAALAPELREGQQVTLDDGTQAYLKEQLQPDGSRRLVGVTDGVIDDGEQIDIDPARVVAIDGTPVGTQNAGTPPVQTQTAQLTTQQPAANTVERDENNLPFVKASDGTTVFGGIRKESGLPSAPIKLSEGFQDENGKGYGLAHIEANHGQQIRNAGFSSVVDFVSFVATNYDEDNIRVGKRRYDGSTTYLLQVTDTHDNTLFIELSKDGSYWNVNSAGIFRKGYSNKKETVVKTEPRQPNNAVSTGSSLSEAGHEGITSSEPNGKPTVSNIKDTNSVPSEQEIPRKKDGTPVRTPNAGTENAVTPKAATVASESVAQATTPSQAGSEITPVGKGPFGNIYLQFQGKPKEAIEFLLKQQDGEAIGALNHPQIGEIDLVWGKTGTAHSDGYGLAKIAKYHPEVVNNLQGIISGMTIKKVSGNRIQLESQEHLASVRLDWDGNKKTWLLTAFEKETPTPLDRTTDVGENLDDLQNDTAPLQSGGVSERSEYSRHTTTNQTAESDEASQTATHSGAIAASRMNAPTTNKDTNSVPSEQEIPREKDGTPVRTPNASPENTVTSPVGQVGAENPGMNPELGNTTTSGVHNVSDPRIGRSLTSQEAEELIQQMEAAAEEAPKIELSEEAWEREFPNGEVYTPLGMAKFGENQLAKMFLKKTLK